LKLTPMMRQYHEIKARYPDSILLFRLGDFYEGFLEDANILSRTLQLVLTSRNSIPMAGIPYHALDPYLKKLITAGYKVAICDQIEDPAQAKGIVKRDVTRVVTPGTVIEDGLLEQGDASFLACIVEGNCFSILFLDISQNHGMIFIHETWEEVIDRLCQYRPSQVLLSEGRQWEYRKDHLSKALPGMFIELLPSWYFNPSKASEEVRKACSSKGSRLHNTDFLEYPKEALIALAATVKYMDYQKLSLSTTITPPKLIRSDEFMGIDAATQENLDLLPQKRGNGKGRSLFQHMNRCKTAAGARLLRTWIHAPIRDLAEIQERQDLVQGFLENPQGLDSISLALEETYDLARIIVRLQLNKSSVKDLVFLRKTLSQVPALHDSMLTLFDYNPSYSFLHRSLISWLDPMPKLSQYLKTALKQDPSGHLGDGKTIEIGFDDGLDEYRDLMIKTDERLLSMESAERARTKISSLKIGHNNVYGFYIEVSKAQMARVPDDYIRKQTLVSNERYTTKNLQELEEKITHAREWVSRLEHTAIERVITEITAYHEPLYLLSTALATIDVLQGFARSALQFGYCRPIFTQTPKIEIHQGRHPVLEIEEEHFHPNDLLMCGKERFVILTGPNMSGKSTFLRQSALICVMAQMGSFVPAQKAILPVVDRVFSRIGARDDIASGKSTFLVEMSETAAILHHATEQSLVLLDEVGRGTSTYDGISIAWAVSEYLHSVLSPFCLFATHYNELTELATVYPGIVNMRVKVLEEEGEVIFLHQVEPGTSDKSYGIEVARIAGLPSHVVERAAEVLDAITRENHLKERVRVLGERELEHVKKSARTRRRISDQQLTIFDASDLDSDS